MEKHQVSIDTAKCVGCGVCANVCAAHNLTINHKKAKTISDHCLMCGQCSAVCPKEAISITNYPVEQIEIKGEGRLNPDDVLNVIRFRRTIRQFKQKEIPSEVISQILEAGRLTHTAKNMQDVSFIVLDREKIVLSKWRSASFRS